MVSPFHGNVWGKPGGFLGKTDAPCDPMSEKHDHIIVSLPLVWNIKDTRMLLNVTHEIVCATEVQDLQLLVRQRYTASLCLYLPMES